MIAYEYEVTRNIPEIGARVWDVLVWRYPEVWLCRKRAGRVRSWLYPAHYTFVFLKYPDHLRPLCPEAPPVLDLARQVAGGWPMLPPARTAPHLRLVD